MYCTIINVSLILNGIVLKMPPLVTFVGEFSTGKSSLINHILGIDESVFRLQTGLGATTDSYQLIITSNKTERGRVSQEIILPPEFSFMNKFNEAVGNPSTGLIINTDKVKEIVILDTPGVVSGYGGRKKFVQAIQSFVKYSSLVVFLFSAEKSEPFQETLSLYQTILSVKGNTKLETVLNKVASAASCIDLAHLYGQLVRHIVTAREKNGLLTAEFPKVKFIDFPVEGHNNTLGVDLCKLDSVLLFDQINNLHDNYLQKIELDFQYNMKLLLLQLKLIKAITEEKFQWSYFDNTIISTVVGIVAIEILILFLGLESKSNLKLFIYLFILLIIFSIFAFYKLYNMYGLECSVDEYQPKGMLAKELIESFPDTQLHSFHIYNPVFKDAEEICSSIFEGDFSSNSFITAIKHVIKEITAEELEFSERIRSIRQDGSDATFHNRYVNCG